MIIKWSDYMKLNKLTNYNMFDSKIGNDCYIYHDSYATLPSSDEERWDEIIMTYASSLSSIHCALPQPLKNIGGSSNVEFSSSEIDEKVVVVGGSKYACFVAR